jgi:hypothetical protein
VVAAGAGRIPPPLYEAFAPAATERPWDKPDVRHTPKHGSRLNAAEIEPSLLERQCLDRRPPDPATVARGFAAWTAERNAERVTSDWQFTTADAGTKLRQLSRAQPIR